MDDEAESSKAPLKRMERMVDRQSPLINLKHASGLIAGYTLIWLIIYYRTFVNPTPIIPMPLWFPLGWIVVGTMIAILVLIQFTVKPDKQGF